MQTIQKLAPCRMTVWKAAAKHTLIISLQCIVQETSVNLTLFHNNSKEYSVQNSLSLSSLSLSLSLSLIFFIPQILKCFSGKDMPLTPFVLWVFRPPNSINCLKFYMKVGFFFMYNCFLINSLVVYFGLVLEHYKDRLSAKLILISELKFLFCY